MYSQNLFTGRGVAAGGRIVVTAQDGRIARAELDPDVLHLPADGLADQLMAAVNGALAEARPPAAQPPPGDQVDLGAVARDFTAVRAHAAGLLAEIVSGIQDAAADLAGGGNLPPGAPVPAAGQLMEQMSAVEGLLSAAAGSGLFDPAAGQLPGSGQAGGLVHAVSVPPGRIARLEADAQLAQVGAEEAGHLVAAAVNAALDSMDQLQHERHQMMTARGTALKAQIEQMNAAALAQIEQFGSVVSLLGRIGAEAGASASGGPAQAG